MRMRALAVGLVALSVAAGCAQAPVPEGDTEKPELSPQAKALVLDQIPTDIPHPLFMDFNGRAELLGYAIDPEPQPGQKLAPGSQLSLKLYWRATGKLEGGYVPFTELVSANGTRVEVEGSGPVRKGELVPSNWEPGKVYVDELSIAVPADLDTTRVSIVVGLKTQPVAPEQPAAEPEVKADSKRADKKVDKAEEGSFGTVYLSVLSGPADSKHGGVLTSVDTIRVPKDKKAQAGAVKRLPAGRPVSAKPGARPLQPTQ